MSKQLIRRTDANLVYSRVLVLISRSIQPPFTIYIQYTYTSETKSFQQTYKLRIFETIMLRFLWFSEVKG